MHRQIGPPIGGARWSDVYTQEIFEDVPSKWKGKGLSTLLETPSRLAFPLATDSVDRYSAVYLILLPALLVGAIRDQTIRWMLIFGGGHLLFWFLLAKDIRFLLPAIPFFALALAASFDLVLTRLMRRVRPAGRVAATTLMAIFFAFPGWYLATTMIRAQGCIPVTAKERDLYLRRSLPAYPIFQTLNQQYGSNYTLYAIGTENMVYFADGAVFGDHFGPMSYAQLGLKRPGEAIMTIVAQAFHPELQRRGVDHLLLSDESYQWFVPDKPDFDRFFHLIYQANGWMLFALK